MVSRSRAGGGRRRTADQAGPLAVSSGSSVDGGGELLIGKNCRIASQVAPSVGIYYIFVSERHCMILDFYQSTVY